MDNARERIMAWSISWEGSICINHKPSGGIQAQVILCNTNLELIQAFAELVGYGRIFPHATYKKDGYNHRPLWRWVIGNFKECLRFCEEVLPYLPSKQQQAKLMIEYCKSRLTIRESEGRNNAPYTKRDYEIAQQVKQLNKDGK